MDEDNPFMLAAQKALGKRVFAHIEGKTLTRQVMHEINQIIYDHRVRSKQNGLDFPQMIALVVPRIGAISLYRRDLDIEGIKVAVVNFALLNPKVTPMELGLAVMEAWPNVKPGDLVANAQQAVTSIYHDNYERITMPDRAADDFAAIKQRQEEIRLLDQGDGALVAWLHNEFDKAILEALNSDVPIPYNNDTPLFPVQTVTIVVPRDSEEAKLLQSGRSGPSCGYKDVEEKK